MQMQAAGWRLPAGRLPGRCRRTLAATAASGAAATGSPEVVVVGGGAAGLTAAYWAADAGARVTVLERMSEAGKKILMSGGTRCNVLPLHADPTEDFFTESSQSALRACFSSWTLAACRTWLEKDVGIALALEQDTAKLFPVSNSSREVRDKLVTACQRKGVRVLYSASLEALERLGEPQAAGSSDSDDPSSSGGGGGDSGSQHTGTARGGGAPSTGADASSSGRRAGSGDGGGRALWRCKLKDGRTVDAERLVLATGGLSFPAVGTDGTGHRILEQLGLQLAPTYAALTPLKGSHPGGEQLPGLSLGTVQLSCQAGGASKRAQQVARRTGFLFTHKGYSGPAVLDVSHHLVMALERRGSGDAAQSQQQAPVLRANWTGEEAAVWDERLRAGGAALVRNILVKEGMRERLAGALCAHLGLADRKASQLKREEREALVAALTAWPLHVDGHEGYKKAEVTGGGLKLSDVNCKTLEVRGLPGLYVCGELLDVFGRIGGFNFWWAWLTGRLAGQGAAAGEEAAKRGRAEPAVAGAKRRKRGPRAPA